MPRENVELATAEHSTFAFSFCTLLDVSEADVVVVARAEVRKGKGFKSFCLTGFNFSTSAPSADGGDYVLTGTLSRAHFFERARKLSAH